jgi:glycosyltransferase involved in cell wall biosynthesis
MKVLFVGNPSVQITDGGSATFLRSISERLTQLPDCTYLIPFPGRNDVQHCVRKESIELVWFLSPYYEPVPTPFVATVWDLGHRMLPEFPEVSTAPGAWTFEAREQYYRHVLPRAARVCCAQHLHPILTQVYGLDPERLRDLPLCVDVETLQNMTSDESTLTPGQSVPYLLYPANFWPHKNHVTLIDMLVLLRDRGHTFNLVLTGADKGNQAYIEQYAQIRDIRDQVIFKGFVAPAVLHRLYRHAFALVYASLLGPDNLPPLEAMALGCPVVCSNYPGASDQLRMAALYFDALDPTSVAEEVLRLYEPAPRDEPWRGSVRDSLIATGQSVVKERTPEVYINQVRALLTELEGTRRLWGTAYRHL